MAKHSRLFGLVGLKAKRKRIPTTEFPDSMTIAQFILIIMNDMKEIGIVEDCVKEALNEDIDIETVDDLPPEGKILLSNPALLKM